MKYLLSTLFLLTIATETFAQPTTTADSIYIIQDSVLIPTRSGVDISAIIVRKKNNRDPLPAILFYTTYYQGAGDNILENGQQTEIM
jgi:hypothetical protein